MPERARRDPEAFSIGAVNVPLGESRDVDLLVSESATGTPVHIPLRVIRGAQPGPKVFVTAGIHGDEINGTGIIRRLIMDDHVLVERGTLILAPLINVLGFEQLNRYLPDRRDLNRSFPGSTRGSLASRYARVVFTEIVKQCDWGIDLHSAAVRRTNYPNIRADLSDERVKKLANACGVEVIVHGAGPVGSFRRSATRAGVPTVILEAGEVWKMEPAVTELGVRCVRNALHNLGLVSGHKVKPAYRAIVEKTAWIRAKLGGFLEFHVSPGDIVEAGQPLATNTTILGHPRNVLESTADGLVLGMATLPAVKPGDPVVHLAIPNDGIARIRRALDRVSDEHLAHRLRDDLATNVHVIEHEEQASTTDAEGVT